MVVAEEEMHNLTQSCRSAVGSQPYNKYLAPRMMFLQLGEARAHRNVVEAYRATRMSKEEQVLATTTGNMLEYDMINDVDHEIDPEMVTNSKDKVKIWGYMMTQYNLKAGLGKFGKKSTSAAMEEFMQLHIMDMWRAMDPSKLSQEERMQALSSLMYLKEKQSGKVKGQACLNGAPQRAYISKEEAALPTVSTESTFIATAIAAKERRWVQCYNVPSAFVNTEVNKDVLMALKGELTGMMEQIKPQIYRKNITVDKKPIREATESAIWTDEGKPTLLQKITKRIGGIRAGCEPVRPVHSEYGNKVRKVSHGDLAR